MTDARSPLMDADRRSERAGCCCYRLSIPQPTPARTQAPSEWILSGCATPALAIAAALAGPGLRCAAGAGTLAIGLSVIRTSAGVAILARLVAVGTFAPAAAPRTIAVGAVRRTIAARTRGLFAVAGPIAPRLRRLSAAAFAAARSVTVTWRMSSARRVTIGMTAFAAPLGAVAR
jgi:hypothetical protein